MKCSMTGQEKDDLAFSTGDCLIEVTTCTGLTVYMYIYFSEDHVGEV